MVAMRVKHMDYNVKSKKLKGRRRRSPEYESSGIIKNFELNIFLVELLAEMKKWMGPFSYPV